jgi:hypothetical protein
MPPFSGLLRYSLQVGVIAYGICVISGCSSRSSDLTQYNRLRLVWAAIRNYESIHKGLPQPNDNEWRFSKNTRYNSVTWRALLLEHMVAIPDPSDEFDTKAVEAEIEYQGKSQFVIGEQIINSNLTYLTNKSIDELPGFQIIAYTVSCRDSNWNQEENFDPKKVLETRYSSVFPKEGSFVVFANGNIAKILYSDRSILSLLVDPPTGIDLNRDFLTRNGVTILDPSRADYRK